MDRSRFYASVRARTSGVFGTSLSQSQVAGMEVILDTAQRGGLSLKHHAYVLATAYHETGGRMQPVNENLNYASPARIREVWPKRFSSTAAALPYVRNPQRLANRVYADRMGNGPEASGDGWRYRGRALPQITGENNYRKASRLVGVDLASDPEAANDPDISAYILIEGMRAGMFTGKRLADFDVSSTGLADYNYVAARSIINGDVEVNGELAARYAKAFEIALQEAGYAGPAPVTTSTENPFETAVPAAVQQPMPLGTPPATHTFWSVIRTLLATAFGKSVKGA